MPSFITALIFSIKLLIVSVAFMFDLIWYVHRYVPVPTTIAPLGLMQVKVKKKSTAAKLAPDIECIPIMRLSVGESVVQIRIVENSTTAPCRDIMAEVSEISVIAMDPDLPENDITVLQWGINASPRPFLHDPHCLYHEHSSSDTNPHAIDEDVEIPDLIGSFCDNM